MDEINRLALQLQNAAYNHGYTDAGEWSDAKHSKVDQRSNDALCSLIRAIEKEITIKSWRND